MCIRDRIKSRISSKKYPAIISIHSFTPFWRNKRRNIDVGILWDSDNRLPDIFFEYFKKNSKDLIIGNNKPYSGRLKNDSIYRHATMNGLSNILVELRQDLILKKNDQISFAELIAKPLLLNKDDPFLFKKKFYSSLA